MMKRIAIVMVLVIASSTAVAYWRSRSDPDQTSEAKQFTLTTVERGPIRQEVSCSGSVVSNLDVEIKCKATGQVVNLPFDISNSVNKGDLLLQVDPVDEERNVRQAQVRLAAAEAKLAQARQGLCVSETELKNSRASAHANLEAAKASSKDKRQKAERVATLLQKNFASPEEVGTAESTAIQAESDLKKAAVAVDGLKAEEQRLELLWQDIKLAEADVDSIKIDLEDAQQRLTETKVYAPISGVVSDRLVQVGQIISSPTMNVGGGTSLLVLSDLSRVFVLASVDESDVGVVQPGQPATIGVDAFPDNRFQGEVVRVATKGEKLSNVVTFEVKIEVLDADKSKLRPEMTADVQILVAQKEDALTVPFEAVQRRGPEKTVLTPADDGGDPQPVAVETGIDDGTRVEIVSGLEEGAGVLVSQVEDGGKKNTPQMGPPPFGGPGGPPPA